MTCHNQLQSCGEDSADSIFSEAFKKSEDCLHIQASYIVIPKEQNAQWEAQLAINIKHNFWFQERSWPNFVREEGQ